jgi:hypothetical protein
VTLEGVEVAVEGEEDEGVLLGVVPAAGDALGEQAADQLGDEVGLWVGADEGVEEDAVDAALGVEDEVGAVAVAGAEVGGAGGLADLIRDVAEDGLRFGAVAEHGEQPAESLEGMFVDGDLGIEGAGAGGVADAEAVADVQCVGDDRAPELGGVFLFEFGFDALEIVLGAVEGGGRDGEALAAGALEGVGDVDR